MVRANYPSYELRKWVRDPVSLFMLSYFVLMGLVGRYLVPIIESRLDTNLAPYYPAVLASMILFTSRIIGSVAGFSILDDRDDNVLLAVKVAPMTLEAFIGLKLGLIYLVSVLGGAFVLWFSDLVPLTAGIIWPISILAAFGAPTTALLINAVASNKIEGFAAVKGLNILVIFPIVGLFMRGAREFIFAFEPGFWPAKALTLAITGQAKLQLTYGGYYWIGMFYSLAVTLAIYQLFKRRV